MAEKIAQSKPHVEPNRDAVAAPDSSSSHSQILPMSLHNGEDLCHITGRVWLQILLLKVMEPVINLFTLVVLMLDNFVT